MSKPVIIKVAAQMKDGTVIMEDTVSYSFEGGYLFYKTTDGRVHNVPLDKIENWKIDLDMTPEVPAFATRTLEALTDSPPQIPGAMRRYMMTHSYDWLLKPSGVIK
ncbi:MAG: hypothetical protein NC311_05930 [Muribaculaceae bacterium]|nr:hypothetical protein [Muribaculaceae bacterium]